MDALPAGITYRQTTGDNVAPPFDDDPPPSRLRTVGLMGVSQRQLGEAFDLPHSRIAAIVPEMGGLAREGGEG